jgi:hypothetical protein
LGETLATSKETVEIAIAKDGKAKDFSLGSQLVGGVHANAEGLTIRQPAGGKDVFIGGWEVHSFSDDHLGFSVKRSSSLVFTETKTGSIVFFNPQTAGVEITITAPFQANATLAPGVWTEVTDGEAHTVPAPSFFPPLTP